MRIIQIYDMKELQGKFAAWFRHRPLFLDSPGYWSIKPQPRAV